MRKVSRPIVAGLTVLVALTQTGCLTNYMWESRLVTAGEHREGRVKFEGDLREAKFNAKGDLAIPGVMTWAHNETENEISGRIIIPSSSRRWFTKTLGFRVVRSDYEISAIPPSPEYTMPTGSHKNQRGDIEEQRERFEKLQFIPGGFPDEFSIPCALNEDPLDSKDGDASLTNASFSGSSVLKIHFGPKKYPETGDIPDTTGKVILTPVTCVLDVASVPACIALMPVVGVILVTGAIVHPCCQIPPEGFDEGMDNEKMREDHRLRNPPVFRPAGPSPLPSAQN